MTRTVLAIGAHPDDEVLGLGGTLAKHAEVGDEVHILIVTEGTMAQYDDAGLIAEKEEAARRCGERLGVNSVEFGALPDMRLDHIPHIKINEVIEETVAEVQPDLVYTHSQHEVNLDHKAVYESTIVATRPGSGVRSVYSYETLSSTEWVGGNVRRFNPNYYVDISNEINRKVEAFDEYAMEVRQYPHPRSERAIRAKAESRGIEAGFEAAEAFEVVKERIQDL